MNDEIYNEPLEDGKYYWASTHSDNLDAIEIVLFRYGYLWRCGDDFGFEIWELNILKKVEDYE